MRDEMDETVDVTPKSDLGVGEMRQSAETQTREVVEAIAQRLRAYASQAAARPRARSPQPPRVTIKAMRHYSHGVKIGPVSREAADEIVVLLVQRAYDDIDVADVVEADVTTQTDTEDETR